MPRYCSNNIRNAWSEEALKEAIIYTLILDLLFILLFFIAKYIFNTNKLTLCDRVCGGPYHPEFKHLYRSFKFCLYVSRDSTHMLKY